MNCLARLLKERTVDPERGEMAEGELDGETEDVMFGCDPRRVAAVGPLFRGKSIRLASSSLLSDHGAGSGMMRVMLTFLPSSSISHPSATLVMKFN